MPPRLAKFWGVVVALATLALLGLAKVGEDVFAGGAFHRTASAARLSRDLAALIRDRDFERVRMRFAIYFSRRHEPFPQPARVFW